MSEKKAKPELVAVRRAARARQQADQRFAEAVRAASKAGHSLREIADGTGVSHESIRRILQDAQPR
jgi:DNA-directed RNA polymerase specialized sigma24 family protein